MLLCSPQGAPLPLSNAAAARPARLDGLRVGLLDNTKAPVDEIMEHLASRLRERVPGVSIFHIAKKHPSLPAEREVIERLAENADVVINALGD
jgi:hypothetical protein